MPEPICMKFGTYIMAIEPISTSYFINPSPQSVSVCVSLLSLLGNNSVKTFLRQRRIVAGVVFYAILGVPKESRGFFAEVFVFLMLK
jgi:hypothetical protein